MKRQGAFRIFWILLFIGACLVLSQMGYSDGDDAYFYHYANSMGFFEYLAWRYRTWVGRMTAEALVYITFRQNLWFWRIVNALMLVLLPTGILRLAAIAARMPEGSVWDWDARIPACEDYDYHNMGIGAAAAAVSGYLLMGAMTFGYAAIWVNGSIFYTWTFTCGTWALIPIADIVFKGETNKWKFVYAIPCAVIAAMSIEQMGAVLLVLEVLAMLYCGFRMRRVCIPAVVQTVLTAVAFAILFLAPGNDLRVAAEIVTWMPEYETLDFGHHLFITVQWLLSSFANENKLFLCGIWLVGIMLLAQRRQKGIKEWIFIMAAGIFTAAALLPCFGITVLSDMGMGISDMTVRIDKVPVPEMLEGCHVAALLWWAAALIFTFVFLCKVSDFHITLLLAYLAGIASEAIMFFSPTMYASGARVYYLTDLLYLFIMLCLAFCLRSDRSRNTYFGIVALSGVIHFIVQIPIFINQL